VQLVIDADVAAGRDELQAIADRLEDPRTILALLGSLLTEYEVGVFATQGRGRWAMDDPATVALKHSGRVLVDTGHLLNQLTNVKYDGDDTVKVNQGDAFYGRFLRDGDRGMPKRDPAPMPQDSDVERWAQKLLDYLVSGTR
jgi:hypothetical protein